MLRIEPDDMTQTVTLSRSMGRASGITWRAATLLIAAVLALRIVYLIWLSPYELVGDEAYYWEWSRHLDLCYYEKGPGLAYLIAAAGRRFRGGAWAVRLPAAASSAVAAWLAGRLAVRLSGG